MLTLMLILLVLLHHPRDSSYLYSGAREVPGDEVVGILLEIPACSPLVYSSIHALTHHRTI
jgi:hypothetical protein